MWEKVFWVAMWLALFLYDLKGYGKNKDMLFWVVFSGVMLGYSTVKLVGSL
jgi:hypothetical protein